MGFEEMKSVAESSARLAVSEMSITIREEIRGAMHDMRTDIKDHLKSEISKHFGEMNSSEHIVQHARIDRFLKVMDELSGGFWRTLLVQAVKWLTGIFLVGYFIVHQRGSL